VRILCAQTPKYALAQAAALTRITTAIPKPNVLARELMTWRAIAMTTMNRFIPTLLKGATASI
jgi:hypothetical protein